MKVALDVSAMPDRLAGAGRYVVEVTRRLANYGVEPTLVTRRHDGARWHDVAPSAKLSSVVPDGRGARLLYEAWSLGSGDAARTTDVWHGPHYTMPHRGDVRAVVTIHDLTFFTDPSWHERAKVAFFRRAITYASRHARVLICVSDFTSRQLDELLPDHAPVVVAPHGVDLERFSRSDTGDRDVFASRNLDFDVPYIVFVGTIEPRKGLDVLLDAFADVARADADVELWIVDQPDAPNTQRILHDFLAHQGNPLHASGQMIGDHARSQLECRLRRIHDHDARHVQGRQSRFFRLVEQLIEQRKFRHGFAPRPGT